ncbi:uncharacterized protein C8Q71DRAFT_363175 [Rhodofomes roseus]|uniref:Terpene synthase n=1 Tax=Rhodofomes roseus TaxID=34475 RepID=A0A4Y9XX44_9APHY|nr:uncharacterized protein C8Q71DRAFT_363175 [Rhodofomes roseus]KAH9830414.1 hypothetical protein C8Q71DRAFT_363175 [Rhodofomes roseus]TFY54680.1 hypothetical protein EVJ58_g8717 [Rhodofomes roseus]
MHIPVNISNEVTALTCKTPSPSTKDIIASFLRTLNISEPTYVQDSELRSRVKAIVATWDFVDQMRPQILMGVTLAETSYNHITNINARVGIALYCALIAYLDDIDLFNSLCARDFPRQLCFPSLKDSTFVVALREVLLGMWNWYPAFGANAIFYGALEYFNGAMLEASPSSRASEAIRPRTLPFVELRRNLSGIPDPFACFIWEKSVFPDEKVYAELIPDTRVYINYINDIVSCYKEELDGDTDNYVYARATVTGKNVSETLLDVIDEWFTARDRIRWMLPGGPAREAWDSFETGFVSLHLVLPRYRLQELLGGEYLATGV